MKVTGNLPVIPTPFAGGAVEYAGLDRLLERTMEHLDGCVVCGSTGEAPALTTAERIAVARHICARLVPQKAVVVGLGHTSVADAAEIGRAAAEAGAQAALVPSPYYFPNSFAMVIDFLGAVAERTDLDIIFYDNPVTTKTVLTPEQLIALGRAVPRVKGVKMTDHNMDKVRILKETTQLAVFGGDDIICFQAFMAGVDGNMIIAPAVYPAAFRECWQAFRSGDVERSFDIYARVLLPWIGMFGPGDEIATTKALFHRLGIFASAETRPPLLASGARRVREALLGYRRGQAAYGDAEPVDFHDESLQK